MVIPLEEQSKSKARAKQERTKSERRAKQEQSKSKRKANEEQTKSKLLAMRVAGLEQGTQQDVPITDTTQIDFALDVVIGQDTDPVGERDTKFDWNFKGVAKRGQLRAIVYALYVNAADGNDYISAPNIV